MRSVVLSLAIGGTLDATAWAQEAPADEEAPTPEASSEEEDAASEESAADAVEAVAPDQAEDPAAAADTLAEDAVEAAAEPAPGTDEEAVEPEALEGPIRALSYQADSGFFLEAWGHGRWIAELPPDFPVDAEGHEVGQGFHMDQRIRVGGAVGWNGIRVATEWDLLTGQLAGDVWDIPGEVDRRRRDTWLYDVPGGVIPREASLSLDPGQGFLLQAGLMPAQTWGLGILANGGQEKDPLAGRIDRGDRMLRGRFRFAPFKSGGQTIPLVFNLGFDRVVEDETARWSEGQNAYHVIAAVLWADPRTDNRLGFFYTFRTQTEPGEAKRPTNAHALDVYGDLSDRVGAGRFRVGAEAVALLGTTERVVAYGEPAGSRIRSFGAAVETEIWSPNDLFGFRLYGGYASASGDPDRGILQDFTFDTNYNVGMVLFDHVTSAIEAGTYALLSDPELSGGPPEGAELLVSSGAVRRSTYLWPSIEVRPLDFLDIRAGWMAAWSTGPIAQPFYTFRAGGSPRNHLDEATDGRFLGHELNWGVGIGRGRATWSLPMRPSLVIQGGHAFLSQDMGGGVANLFMATGRVDF